MSLICSLDSPADGDDRRASGSDHRCGARIMLEYGRLSGLGGTLTDALVGAFDSLTRATDDLVRLAMEQPAVTVGVVVALLAWALVRGRR